MLIQGVVFDDERNNQGYRQIFERAWRTVNKVDNKTLGHKNSIPLEPYLRWVRACAQSLVMPYPSILPVIMEPVAEGDVPYTVLHPNMPTSLEDLKRGQILLKEERGTFEAQFYASEKKVLEAPKQIHEEWSLNAYIAPKRMRSTFLSQEFLYFISFIVSPKRHDVLKLGFTNAMCSPFLSKANLNF